MPRPFAWSARRWWTQLLELPDEAPGFHRPLIYTPHLSWPDGYKVCCRRPSPATSKVSLSSLLGGHKLMATDSLVDEASSFHRPLVYTQHLSWPDGYKGCCRPFLATTKVSLLSHPKGETLELMDQRRPSAEINQHVALEIEAPWLESIKYKAGISMHREPPANPTIFRVPSSLQHWNKCDYEPKLVSIGPYHRGKSMDLKAMEELKWRMLHHYLSIVPNGSNNENLRKMKDLEKQARNCYLEVIDLNSDQFMEMLLLDGCFLVQIFIVYDDEDDEQTLQVGELKSLLVDNMWFGGDIFRDLLLLENQLPYFIVKNLLDTLSKPGWDNFRLQKAIISSFIGFLPDKKYIPHQRQLEQELEVDHFLHLLHKWLSNIPKLNNLGNRRSCWQLPSKLHCSALSLTINKTMHCLSKLLPCCHNPLPSEKSPWNAPTVTEFVEAGVKIKILG